MRHQLSPNAIFYGLLVSLSLVFPLLIPLELLAPDDAFRYLGHHPGDLTGARLAALTLCGGIMGGAGGFVSARTAPESKTLNAAMTGIASIILGIILDLLLPELFHRYPLWHNLLDYAIILPAAYTGGAIAQRMSPGTTAGALVGGLAFWVKTWLKRIVLMLLTVVASFILFYQVDAPSPEIVSRLSDAAAHGDPQAGFQLALFYSSGRGVTKDSDKARDLAEVAAEEGSAEAQSFYGADLARICKGNGSYCFNAYKWLSLAAKNGNPPLLSSWLNDSKAHLTPSEISEADQWVATWKPTQAPSKEE